MSVGCASLPPMQAGASSHALAPAYGNPILKTLAPSVRQDSGMSNFLAVDDGRLAFAMRALLLRTAARSIDIQTFLWHADATGTLLYDELMRAADRGVRVRLLLDDANTAGLDPLLVLAASHPNLEVRLYNPFVNRSSQAVGFLTDFNRVNRRMHNKSFTVDNVITVVGGRNIADEYFEAGSRTGFVDLDVVAIGDVVAGVSDVFDLYWNSPSAYPSGLILHDVAPMRRADFTARVRAVRDHPDSKRYREAVDSTAIAGQLRAGNLALEPAAATVVYDDPAKTLSPAADLQLLPRIEAAVGHPVEALDMISPYFVPGELGTETLSAMATRGVRVRVLTNSLAATDEKVVHAGYAKRRLALLRAGVQLFELVPNPEIVQRRALESGRGSNTGLHAKTYAVDRRRMFVGSFNLDLRSSKLNTEMGMVIDSPFLAGRLAEFLDNAPSSIAYRVILNDVGDLRWIAPDGSVFSVDPQTGWLQRALVRIASWLPIDWLL